jgi:hypothetical protein
MPNDAWQDKQDKIRKLLAMQRKFIELDHAQGVDMKDYFAPQGGDALDGYRDEYRDLAMEVVDAAHTLKGSKRD